MQEERRRREEGMTHDEFGGEIHVGLRGRSSRRQIEGGREGSDQIEGFPLEIDYSCTITKSRLGAEKWLRNLCHVSSKMAS